MNKASYCKFRERKNAQVFATALTAFGIATTVAEVDISPYASTDPEDRDEASMLPDIRYSVEFAKSQESAFLAMRSAAKAANQTPEEYMVGKTCALQAFKQAETAEARCIYALENRDEAIAREEEK